MATTLKCARCGAPLPDSGPDGHCPACLMGLALGADDSGKGLGENAPEQATRPFPRWFGDYELLEEIARGGMGVVYRARQISLNRPVALKMMIDSERASAAINTRFQIEAEAAAQLNHPNIVPVFETGVHKGKRFLSMKLLEGGSLADKLADFACGPDTPRDRQTTIAELMATVATAVHHAHQRGVLHRDLKPANILLDSEGRPHVADFGLAKILEDQTCLTQTGAFLGTPAYMAPETMSAEHEITTAADIYSLGAIFYHLLTGRPPFQAASALETVRRAAQEEALPPNRLNPAIHKDLSTICLKCLNKEPAQRYASAQALADDLARWQSGETISAVPATWMDQLVRWRRRNPGLAVMAAIALLLLAAIATISTFAAVRIDRARRRAEAADASATQKLWDCYLAQARAQRLTGKAGRRFEALAAISNAVSIRPSLDLRNEAIAALALADIRPVTFAPPAGEPYERVAIDWPRNRYIAAESNGAVTLRDLADHLEQIRLPGQGVGVKLVGEISADGRWLCVKYQDDSTSVWDLKNAAPKYSFPRAAAVGFTPDARELTVVATNGDMQFTDLASGAPTRKFHIRGLPLIWNPDGKTLVYLRETNVFWIDSQTGQVRHRFDFPNWLFSAAWSPDGRHLAVAGDDKLLYVLDTETGQTNALAGHQGAVTSVAFSPDGSLLASDSWDGKTRLWDFRAGKEIISIPSESEGISFSPDGRHLAVLGSMESVVQVFEIALNDVFAEAPPPPAGAQAPSYDALVFGGNDEWLATSQDNELNLWNPATMQPLTQSPAVGARSAQWLPEQNAIFSYNDQQFYRLPFHQSQGAWKAGAIEPFRPEIPPVWRATVPAAFTNFTDEFHPDRTSASTNGETVAAVFHDRAYIFDMPSNLLQAVTGEQTWMKFVGISPDGKRLATGGWNNRNVKIWNAATGALERELTTGYSPNAAFSPDGKWLVTSTSVDFSFWRVSDWALDHQLKRPPWGLPGPLAFSKDGKVLALAYTRGVVRLVSPDSGQTLAQFEPTPESEVIALALNSDLSALAMTRYNQPPQVWRLKRIRAELAGLRLDWAD